MPQPTETRHDFHRKSWRTKDPLRAKSMIVAIHRRACRTYAELTDASREHISHRRPMHQGRAARLYQLNSTAPLLWCATAAP